MKTLKVTLEIQVDEWEPAFEEDEIEGEEVLDDYEARDVAGVLSGLNEHTSIELFAGSEINATFKECRVLDATWVEK
jgi:hypothetical protein